VNGDDAELDVRWEERCGMNGMNVKAYSMMGSLPLNTSRIPRWLDMMRGEDRRERKRERDLPEAGRGHFMRWSLDWPSKRQREQPPRATQVDRINLSQPRFSLLFLFFLLRRRPMARQGV
jgi:hypothetical protein